jgi:hypothetical protein
MLRERVLKRQLAEAQAQIARLESTLVWYADKTIYRHPLAGGEFGESRADQDDGEKARHALAASREGMDWRTFRINDVIYTTDKDGSPTVIAPRSTLVHCQERSEQTGGDYVPAWYDQWGNRYGSRPCRLRLWWARLKAMG